MEKIKTYYRNHKSFVNYFLISCFVTIIDIGLSFVIEKLLLLIFPTLGVSSIAALIGNATGIIVGFIIQYILCTKKVYAGSSVKTLVIFFLTWALSFALAEGIIYVIRTLIFASAEGIVYFLIAKFFSIVIPFFLTYYLRKILIPEKESNKKIKQNIKQQIDEEEK